jgi:hypothetical protein
MSRAYIDIAAASLADVLPLLTLCGLSIVRSQDAEKGIVRLLVEGEQIAPAWAQITLQAHRGGSGATIRIDPLEPF